MAIDLGEVISRYWKGLEEIVRESLRALRRVSVGAKRTQGGCQVGLMESEEDFFFYKKYAFIDF